MHHNVRHANRIGALLVLRSIDGQLGREFNAFELHRRFDGVAKPHQYGLRSEVRLGGEKVVGPVRDQPQKSVRLNHRKVVLKVQHRAADGIGAREIELRDHGSVRTASPAKRDLFSAEERLEMVEEVFKDDDGIEGCQFEGLLVDFARDVGAQFVIRGLRAVSDFEYEFQMAQMNRELWSGAETVFLTPDQKYSFLSASLVRQVSSLGGDVSRFVSEPVLRRLRRASGE